MSEHELFDNISQMIEITDKKCYLIDWLGHVQSGNNDKLIAFSAYSIC